MNMRFNRSLLALALLFAWPAYPQAWIPIGPGKAQGLAFDWELDSSRIGRDGPLRSYYLRLKGTTGDGTERAVNCAERHMSYKKTPYGPVPLDRTNDTYRAAFEYVCRDFKR
jgi:hypothetical protein